MDKTLQDKIDNFLQYATVTRTIARGEILDSQLMLSNIVYYVKTGCVKICYEREGREMIFEFGLEGQFISNLFSFFTGQKSQLYIQALRRTKLVGIPRPYFEQVVNQDAEFSRNYIMNLEQLTLDLLRKQVMLFAPDPAERIRMLKKWRPELFAQVPLRHIAHYMDIAPETMSRVMGKM